MRCDICDKALSDKEVAWNEDIGTWEPCTVCLDIALDAAYGHGRPDDLDFVPLLDDSFDEVTKSELIDWPHSIWEPE